jgi:hypothetical protein
MVSVLTCLPKVISGVTSDTELFARLVDMMLTGMPGPGWSGRSR